MRQNERAGLLYALAGFSALSFGDAVIKTMAGQWSPVAIAALRFSLAAVGLAALLAAREGRTGFRLARPRAQFGRGAALAVSSTIFFTSLFVLPLATATAIGFTTPMFTAFLAALLLGEPLRRQTLIASALAFGGVLVILRPNLAEAGWWAVLPIFSAITFSLLIIGNRAVAGTASALAMQFWVAAFAAPILLIAAPLFAKTGVERFAIGWPHWSIIARCGFVAVSATCAHWLIYLGTTRAGAAAVAPATYIQLLVATVLGWLWFDTHPDAMTMLGAAIIVAAGIYLWRAGQVREPAITD
ncbi:MULTISPECIES: DMT family transporter [unclassified Novosphingobium]|uniref:DMT family transporter n=1 Tax=unclassified Novosphingobium TaxID=2644732 RepID=UPI0025EA96AA|nr:MULTISPECIES: DMT family transporter [unclassified Novosphingobium]HQV04016.1 DMT family transporter [Novosphingobium sp.]